MSHESEALARFQAIATSYGHEHFSGQGLKNRIIIAGNVYHQFGDLRVDLPWCTLIVEVESSGNGTTNLVKYRESFESGRLKKPMKLLHIFRQVSANDYQAHMVVWRFLFPKIQASLGEKFEGHLLTYRDGIPSSLDSALSLFEDWLRLK
jgi:hypothetical protein